MLIAAEEEAIVPNRRSAEDIFAEFHLADGFRLVAQFDDGADPILVHAVGVAPRDDRRRPKIAAVDAVLPEELAILHGAAVEDAIATQGVDFVPGADRAGAAGTEL